MVLRRLLASGILILALSACGPWYIGTPLPPPPSTPRPSPTLSIVIPTNTITILTVSPNISITPSATFTTFPPGGSLTPALEAEVIGCNTSFDITHGMREVTNAYVTISNTGGVEAPNLCATLSASDEAREHPDKSACIPSLPGRSLVRFKLTVDTGFKQDTSIAVEVTVNGNVVATAQRESCQDIGLPFPNLQYDVPQPIP